MAMGFTIRPLGLSQWLNCSIQWALKLSYFNEPVPDEEDELPTIEGNNNFLTHPLKASIG
jgi:hypothetical protein